MKVKSFNNGGFTVDNAIESMSEDIQIFISNDVEQVISLSHNIIKAEVEGGEAYQTTAILVYISKK